MGTLPSYVLITPARNEARYIEHTLKSIVAQTVRPLRWIIVSDGSTDSTDDIVLKYVKENSWLELLRMPERQERHFAGKVHAFNAGYSRLKDLQYDVIGNIDADTSYDPEHFAFILGKLASEPQLGIAGTAFIDASNHGYDYRYVSRQHVSGPCQIFRRECFEDIGGYVPVKGGGIDYIAVVTARMKGWKTKTFTEKTYRQHREMGASQDGILMNRFKYGAKDYSVGNHPLWELFRVVHQVTNRPWIIGGFMLGAGYVGAWIRNMQRPVSKEFIQFQRSEQKQRLKNFFKRKSGVSV